MEVIDSCSCRPDICTLDQEMLLPEEQKGCRKSSRGTNDLLYIDRARVKEVKSRNKNLAMAWRDYKEAYDMVPHSWIMHCLDLFGVAENTGHAPPLSWLEGLKIAEAKSLLEGGEGQIFLFC